MTYTILTIIILAAGLGVMAWIDFTTGVLPDFLQIILALGAIAILVVGSPIGIGWTLACTGALINAAVFWSLRWIMTQAKGREAMGLGDVKLLAVGGLWLGPWALPYIMAVAGVSTLVVVGTASLIMRKASWRGEIPLGPGLAIGILSSYLAAIAGMPGIVSPMSFESGF